MAWQEAQPPMLNIVSPFATFGAYWAKAEAGTVAGLVTIQKATAPRTAPVATMTTSARNVSNRFIVVSHPSFKAAPHARPYQDDRSKSENKGRAL
jgi:hypothetical protein